MSVKLFYKDQYLKEFKGEVVECLEKDGKYHLLLEETAFFPGGGGQPSDKGTIENIEVIDVYEEKGKIYHVLEKKPVKLHRLNCKIDWEHRFDGMQQHLGQHVLSGCFFTLFNANTVSFHLGKEISTVDIAGYLDENQIREAELRANEVIRENHQVVFTVPSKSELKKIKLRRDLPNTDEEIRVVNIVDLDINACCGVHPVRTLDLQLIKIRRWEKHKGATRIEFLTGKRAMMDYINKDRVLNDICRYLSSSEEEAIKGIKNLSDGLKEANDKVRKLMDDLSKYEIKEMIENGDKIKNITVITKVFHGEDNKYVSKLASKLTEKENVVALIALINGDRVNLIFASSKNLENLNMNELLKDSITLIDGRGGGSKYQAQGGGKNNANLESALLYANNKIKELV